MKYKNLIELSKAFKNGDLNGYVLRLDNDYSSLYYTGPVPDGLSDEEAEMFCDRKTDDVREWFQGHGHYDLGDACTAAGIPNEWV